MDYVVTNSLLKTFKECPKKAQYTYVENLAPRIQRSKPLKRGTWFHELLEAKYKGESVTAVHKANSRKFYLLLDEEKEQLGDLPTEMADLYRSYVWYYRGDASWKVKEVEKKVSATLPSSGITIQGKADGLIEDEAGDLWAIDHKTHEILPNWDYRMLDPQSALYIWLFRQNLVPVRGFIWNYIVPKAPKPLKFNLNGKLSKTQPAVMDYPTAVRPWPEAVRPYLNEEVQGKLAALKRVRYDHDLPQTSSIFRRDLIEKTDYAIAETVADLDVTAARYREFREGLEDDPGRPVERNVGRACDWCPFRNLCVSELMGYDSKSMKRREYTVADPMGYYNERQE